jgi:hypothetical protein
VRRIIKRQRPSPGFFVGLIALLVALGGTAVGLSGQAANGARRIDFRGTRVDPAPSTPPFSAAAHRILQLDELRVKASCIRTGPQSGRVYVTFDSSVKADLNWGYIRFDNPGSVPVNDGVGLAPGGHYAVADLSGSDPRFLNGEFIYRNSRRTITVALWVQSTADGPCKVQGTALPAPN